MRVEWESVLLSGSADVFTGTALCRERDRGMRKRGRRKGKRRRRR